MKTWILQKNFTPESLVKILARLEFPYLFAEPIPFSDGELREEISPPTPCVVYGATSMIKAAKRRNWTPGVFFTEEAFRLETWVKELGMHVLNHDALVLTAEEALAQMTEKAFIRPDDDFKGFTGQVFSKGEFERVTDAVGPKTKVVMSSPKEVLVEWRTFVVGGRVVAASRYRPFLEDWVPDDVVQFSQKMAGIWGPESAYVLDVCEFHGELKIVEFNCINGAGFYRADVQKIVEAIEGL